MFRTVVRLTPTFALSIFSNSTGQYDQDLLNRPQVTPPQTGWDRVKKMYSGSEYEEMSLELNTVLQSALCGAFIGACMGGFVSSRVAYLNFIENNQATIYKSTADAKKKLQDYVTVAFAKGAYKWGWRLSFFTGIFSLTSTTVSVYRGDTSLIEYVSAGALTGALYKIDMGLAAMLVGAGLGLLGLKIVPNDLRDFPLFGNVIALQYGIKYIGTVLSAAAGLTILGILKVTGLSMADIRKALYKLKEAREDQYNQALEKAAKEKNNELTEHHKIFVEERGEEKIDNIN